MFQKVKLQVLSVRCLPSSGFLSLPPPQRWVSYTHPLAMMVFYYLFRWGYGKAHTNLYIGLLPSQVIQEKVHALTTRRGTRQWTRSVASTQNSWPIFREGGSLHVEIQAKPMAMGPGGAPLSVLRLPAQDTTMVDFF